MTVFFCRNLKTRSGGKIYLCMQPIDGVLSPVAQLQTSPSVFVGSPLCALKRRRGASSPTIFVLYRVHDVERDDQKHGRPLDKKLTGCGSKRKPLGTTGFGLFFL